MVDTKVAIHFLHGGMLVTKEGVHVYKGCTLEEDIFFEEDRLSRLELLWAIWGLGYEKCGPLYYKDEENGGFKELKNDSQVTSYVASFGDDEDVVVYVDSPYDEISKWKRLGKVELEAHIDRATILEVGNMVIHREPKEEATTLDNQEQTATLGQEEEVVTVKASGSKSNKEVVEGILEDAEDSEGGNDSDGSDSEDRDYEDLEDADASDVDAHQEYLVITEKTKKQRLEAAKKRKALLKAKSIQLGPAGVDKGLENYLSSGYTYDGLVAGSEEYIGSSDIDSDSLPSDNEDEDDPAVHESRTRRRRTVHYDPNCKEPLWELGMIFKSIHQFRDAVVYYAVKRGVQVYYTHTDRKRSRVRCRYVEKKEGEETGKRCPWLLFASLDKRTGNFRIKNYHPVHECQRQNRNRLCSSSFIAKHLKKDIKDNPAIKVWQIRDLLKERFSVHKDRTLCRRAKEIVLKEMNGDYRVEFSRLYDYRDCLLQTNPGSTCVIDVDIIGQPRQHVFKGMYVCFSAMKEGFKKGCRRCVGFDGCFLKGIVKGELLTCVAKNGNNQIYPIAWAVTHTETKETWSWFLELVRTDLELGKGDKLTVVTDMQKGLEFAVQNVLPDAEHRECARHIIANWAKKWKGVERRKAFWRIAKSTFEAELKDNLKELSTLGDDNIVPDLISYNLFKWCRVYFKEFSCCDTVDNNFSETFNSWILGARHKSIISMLEEIRNQVMTRHGEMIAFKDTWGTDISPLAYKVIEKNSIRAMRCSITWNGDDGYEVAEGEYGHVVSLSKKTCSCRAWTLKGIPCAHAIAAMHSSGLDPIQYVEHWYHKETYIQAYRDFIQPMPNLKMIPEGPYPPIEPPLIKPLPGRPKKNRKRPADELQKFGKASRSGVQMTCSYCKDKNHNTRGCPRKKAGEPPKLVCESVVASSSASNKRGRKASAKSKDKQVPTTGQSKGGNVKNKVSTGYGVFISERTGWTCQQNGKPDGNIVITTGSAKLKSSVVITGDLGFTPKKRKWKGKEVVTQDDLMSTRANKQVAVRIGALEKKKSQAKTVKVTEEQRQRAARNKEAAQKLLAAKTQGAQQVSFSQPQSRVTRSQASKSSTQPSPSNVWKV